LEQLFEKITENAKTAPQEPANAVKTILFPHQKQALSWMIACESNDNLPPFWEEKGPQNFFNLVTNHSSSKRPASVKGGILADDMGLGKTLEIIALIVTNFKNGKNLVTVDKTKPVNLETKGLVKKKARQRSQMKPKKEMIIEIMDDDDDEEKAEESLAPPLPSFNAKDDPEFNVAMDVVIDVKPKVNRRPKRAVKRPAKYTYDDDDDDDGNEHTSNEKDSSFREAAKAPRRERSSNHIVVDTLPLEPSVEAPLVVENEVVISTSQKNGMIVEENGSTSVVENEVVVSTMSVSDSAMEEIENTYPDPVYNTNQFLTYKSKKTKASGSRATLIVCPLSVLGNWQDEISNHVWPGLLDVYTYYGSDRTRDSEDLVKKDIVLTTYQTVSSDKSKDDSPLKAIKWLRVVLDEGHIIRNPSTRQAKAIHELNAERRWVVTGTPIQNSMKDLWSIICFLRLDPFTDRQWWRRVIERPINDGEQDALVKLRQLMKVIALRRTKTQLIDGKPIVQLPEKSIFMNYIELSPEERDIYKAVSEKGKVTIGKYMKAGTLLKNYTEVLAILTRLRQLCCHPKLCTAALEAAAKEAVEKSTPEELRRRLSTILAMVVTSGVDEECPICLDSLNVPVITHCAHIFCKKCIEDVIKFTSPSCPMCRGVISIDKLVDPPSDQEEEDEAIGTEWTSSAKVDALLAALEKQRMADPSGKCLVVSQFVSFLKLLREPLEGRGFKFRLFDGSLNQEKRVAAIREFSDCNPDSPTIFLMSLKTGGVGLNLTAASRVYLMDPAWNPAAEDQCFDRCHRLGQQKAVEIHKFIVKDSVEERMLEMQERKRKLMTGAFAKPKAEEARRQKINDVVNLFA